MYIYLNEMFPPVQHLASSALMYLSFISMFGIVTGYSIDIFSRYTIAGILNIFLIAFILRLMDELKDDDIDRELFPHRPLPSGRVTKRDIIISLTVSVKLFIGIQCYHFSIKGSFLFR